MAVTPLETAEGRVLLTTAEAAEMLGHTAKYVCRLVRHGVLARATPRRWPIIVDRADVLALLARRKGAP